MIKLHFSANILTQIQPYILLAQMPNECGDDARAILKQIQS